METRKLSALKANPLNPRGEVVHDAALRELAASIKSQGVLQPVLITPDGTIIAGHRRVAAAKLADFSEIPVIVRELTEAAQLQVMLVENIQRNDLTLLQTAKAFQQLTERGLSVNLIAKAIGVTKRTVSEHLMIFKLPAELHAYYNGVLGLRTVPRLLELSVEDQLRIGHEAGREGWGEIKVSSAVYRITKPRLRAPANTSILDRVFERIENGYFLLDEIMICSECGHQVFNVSEQQMRNYLQDLVKSGRIQVRKQPRSEEFAAGAPSYLYVPVDDVGERAS